MPLYQQRNHNMNEFYTQNEIQDYGRIEESHECYKYEVYDEYRQQEMELLLSQPSITVTTEYYQAIK